MDENPLKYIKLPKWSERKIEVYEAEECERILKASRQRRIPLRWDLLIYTALITGMRRGELLYTVWSDIDLASKTSDVSPKPETPETWQWLIKDTDRRTLRFTDEALAELAEHQSQQPEHYANVFVPPQRLDRIQQLRRQGR